MRLREWLERYPGVRLAEEGDSGAIRAFFEAAPMQVPAFDIRYERAPGFFDLLRCHGDRFFVFLGEDEAGRVTGTGALVLRPGWERGRPATFGILGDLRVAFSRRNSRLWRDIYAGLLRERRDIDELADVDRFYTVILDGNRQALAAYDRLGSHGGRLRAVAPFIMRNVIARLPWARLPREAAGFRVSPATEAGWAELESLFLSVQRGLPFGYREPLADRLRRWPGLERHHFLCAYRGGELAAFTALWSPQRVKRTWVSRLPRALAWLERATRPFPALGIRLPRAGETLHAPVLTQLTFAPGLAAGERRHAFLALLHHAFRLKARSPWHCLSVCDFAAWNLAGDLRGFLREDVPITVYEVLAPDSRRPGSAACPPGADPAAADGKHVESAGAEAGSGAAAEGRPSGFAGAGVCGFEMGLV
jgi:hypothetical protein